MFLSIKRIDFKASELYYHAFELKKICWLKVQDRVTYKWWMLTLKSYSNISLSYLCETD